MGAQDPITRNVRLGKANKDIIVCFRNNKRIAQFHIHLYQIPGRISYEQQLSLLKELNIIE